MEKADAKVSGCLVGQKAGEQGSSGGLGGGGGLSCIRVTVVNLPVESGTFSIIEF